MSPPGPGLPAADLDRLLDDAPDVWSALRGARLLVTGGTGTIGRWLVESLVWANRRRSIGARLSVLSRDPDRLPRALPHVVSAPGVEIIAGDVRTFTPPAGAYTHVVHGAAESSRQRDAADHRAMFTTIVDGTRRVLDLAAEREASRLLFLSSGAVYGPQRPEVARVDEDDRGGPDLSDPAFAYGEAKRAAEMLCSVYDHQIGVPHTVARIFTIVGPNLALDGHFAVGNFLADALAGRPVRVAGSGAPVRSYLYMADVAEWLWRVLLFGTRGAAYNVGSERAVSIRELAETVARVVGDGRVAVEGAGDVGPNPGRYVPSTRRARADLGVGERVSLEEAIARSARAHGWGEPDRVNR